MQAVDTNVLVRLLAQDDLSQADRAADLFANHPIWIAKTVLLETAWVLRSAYAFNTPQVTQALRAVAGLENVSIEDSLAVARAFELVAPCRHPSRPPPPHSRTAAARTLAAPPVHRSAARVPR